MTELSENPTFRELRTFLIYLVGGGATCTTVAFFTEQPSRTNLTSIFSFTWSLADVGTRIPSMTEVPNSYLTATRPLGSESSTALLPTNTIPSGVGAYVGRSVILPPMLVISVTK